MSTAAGAPRDAPDPSPAVEGLLLAAGGGTRMGTPKALLRDDDGNSWVRRAAAALQEGGCPAVTVVLGARAAEAAQSLEGLPGTRVVVAEDWADGMGTSLRAGLADVADRDADCVVVSLVDLPDVPAAVVARLLHEAGRRSGALARATYGGRPGHPVLLGRDHWGGVLATARGDRGARDYLEAHPAVLVECGDLATGRDVDFPADRLPPATPRRPAPGPPG